MRARSVYLPGGLYILDSVSKHLVDIDERALRAARAELGTRTIKDTVNNALLRVVSDDGLTVEQQLDVLASAKLAPRESAWR